MGIYWARTVWCRSSHYVVSIQCFARDMVEARELVINEEVLNGNIEKYGVRWCEGLCDIDKGGTDIIRFWIRFKY